LAGSSRRADGLAVRPGGQDRLLCDRRGLHLPDRGRPRGVLGRGFRRTSNLRSSTQLPLRGNP
jgi:hypothetical protein